MSPWRAYLLLLQDHARWKGTYGEMIRLNLQGDESPYMDVVTPSRSREMSETCTRQKKGRFTGDTLANLNLGGLALPPGRWPWEAHDVTIVTLDVTQCQD
jgi:hypothetical protein